jgi:hypothetical protein
LIIRRAVLLRQKLEEKFRLRPNEPPKIDEDVLRAFLTIDSYRHGARSMESIIRACDPVAPPRQLTRSSLPPRAQLDMHVDASKFLHIADRNP